MTDITIGTKLVANKLTGFGFEITDDLGDEWEVQHMHSTYRCTWEKPVLALNIESEYFRVVEEFPPAPRQAMFSSGTFGIDCG